MKRVDYLVHSTDDRNFAVATTNMVNCSMAILHKEINAAAKAYIFFSTSSFCYKSSLPPQERDLWSAVCIGYALRSEGCAWAAQ